MKNNNDTLVLFTLAIANEPLTITELSFRSGRSYNTVKKVVMADDRVAARKGRPVKYYFPIPSSLDSDVVRLQNNMPRDGWVAWISNVAQKVPDLVRIDKTRSSNDIHKQAIVVEALGVNLIEFARQLQANKDKPDWFTLLGGKE
jgi:hypothetical protein